MGFVEGFAEFALEGETEELIDVILNESKKIRLCTHKNIKDNLQEMLIIHPKDCYHWQPPHHRNAMQP